MTDLSSDSVVISSTINDSSSSADNDDVQITHVLNRDKKYLSEHGQKLFNAINVLLDEEEQLELTQSLFKYQREHNVFTLVRSCRELFDTSRKKSLMLFMRPVIPVRDRFHYDEYYKLFFPEEFSIEVRSIFSDLIPKDLLEKTLKKANEKKKLNHEKEMQKEQNERLTAIKLLEQVNYDLNVDLQKLMSKTMLPEEDPIQQLKLTKADNYQNDVVKIAGFRIIDLAPQENESLGFDICLGPTGTFIMISYVEPTSLVEKLGMKIGDELVSVNDISFKMIDIEQAIDVLSTEPTLRIVLQTSGFMPEDSLDIEKNELKNAENVFEFNNKWVNPFGVEISQPFENKTTLKRFIRRVSLRPKTTDKGLGIKIRGGIEYSLGVFISYVEPNSNADLVGLKVADQIIEVNGQTFSRISSDDALFILKSSLETYYSNKLPIKMTIRYLGKLPLLVNNSLTDVEKLTQKEIDQSIFIENKLSSEIQPALFETNIENFRLFKFYFDEYKLNHISIKYLVYLFKNSFKHISKFNIELLTPYIQSKDVEIFKILLKPKNKLIEQSEDKNTYKSRILTDDFKNGILIRSTEVLNDLNINSATKTTKFDTFFLNEPLTNQTMSKEILFGTNNSQLTSTSSLNNASSVASNALVVAPPSQLINNNKVTLDQIASILLKQNFVLTALEFHTELAETGRELPRLRDYFSNPSHFEQPLQQQQSQFYSGASSLANSSNNAGFYPLHKTSSIQTFDSLDLTRYSDDVDQNKFNDDKICVLEFELRKAKETITQLRNTLTLATDPDVLSKKSNPKFNCSNEVSGEQSSIKSKDANKHSNENFKNENINILNADTNSESKYIISAQTANLSNNLDSVKLSNVNNSEEDENGQYDDENDEDYAAETDSNKKVTEKIQSNKINYDFMPHDKNVINFLINEYLLEQNYKMTHITFAEENESLDLEDWDVVGLNRSKPPNLCQLYKYYLNKKNNTSVTKDNEKMSNEKKTSSTFNTKTQTSFAKETNEIGVQTLLAETISVSTNTHVVQVKSAETYVNLDHDMFDKQKMQISKLLEKQEILLKSIAKLETEMENLTTERELNLKKIDMLSVDLERTNRRITRSDSQIASEINTNNVEKNETFKLELDNLIEKQEIPHDRKIPVVFKDLLHKYCLVGYESNIEIEIVDVIKNTKVTNDCLVDLLLKYLPILIDNIQVEKRIFLIPLILATCLVEKEQKPQPKFELLKSLFNLIDKPTLNQRSIIMEAFIQFSKLAGPTCVSNYVLPQCWEQLNDKNEEKRMLVAEACSKLAPFIYNDMRSSLMFSILKQIIEEEKNDSVRIYAAQSLSVLINYIKDEQKFIQCIQLLDLCATDKNENVVKQVENLMLPSLCLWALSIGKLNDSLIMHLVNQLEFHLLNSFKKNENESIIDHEHHAKTYLNLVNLSLQFVLAFILVQFREPSQSTTNINSEDEHNDYLSKLNGYFYLLQEKLNVKIDLYKLDSILEDYFHLTKKYLNLIETDSWSSNDLSNAFTWLSDKFLRKLMQICAQVDARDPLCACFVQLFSNFVLIFAIDYELIRSKIIVIFEKLLNINTNMVDSDNYQQNAIEQILTNKSCPLFKAILPVYFVGILSTLVDVETYGWLNMDLENLSDQSIHSTSSYSLKSETSPSLFTNQKVINSTSTTPLQKSKVETKSLAQLSIDKRIEHMNNYLKNLFFTLSLNQTNLDGLVSIYELMKNKSKSSEYIIQMLLSTLWDGIVHVSLYVRCNTAKLFEILVQNCDEYLLSTRILPALITLANDLDKMVRCSSISPLTSIIENCNNKEILERVYTQLQAFLSDPILKDEYLLQIELLKTFRRISTKVNSKFREELILPYLAILTMQIRTVINDNDYEFTISSFTASLRSLNQQQSPKKATSTSSAISSSSSSSIYSNRESLQQQQTQLQDIQKICALVFNIYQKICLPGVNNENDVGSQQTILISRQSIKESLIPGLINLKDIFQNNIIQNSSSNNQNEYTIQLESIINKIEHSHSNESTPSPCTNNFHSNTNSQSLTPVTTHTDTLSKLGANSVNILSSATTESVGELVNAFSSSSLSSINSAINGSFINNNTNVSSNQNGLPDNSNFKSFVFKGITNFKDHSKDKLSNFLLTNKTFKK